MSDNVVPLSGQSIEKESESLDESVDVGLLQRELSKWRERVPPLALALRARSKEVDSLTEQLAGLQVDLTSARALAGAEAGGRARQVLIEELEAKCDQVGANYQQAEGQLRAREIELDDMRKGLASWKAKWGALADTVDQQDRALAAGAHQQQAFTRTLADKNTQLQETQQELDRCRTELLEAQRELEQCRAELQETQRELEHSTAENAALTDRNAKILETTDLANRQMQRLGADLEQLRQRQHSQDQEFNAELASRDQQHECAQAAAIAQLRQELESDAAQQIAALEAQQSVIEAEANARQAIERAAAEQRVLLQQHHTAEMQALLSAVEIHFEAESAIDKAERQHLDACLNQAQAVVRQREEERRQIATRITADADRYRLLQGQLEELSVALDNQANTIVSLEAEVRNSRAELQSRQVAMQGLRHAADQAQHRVESHRDEIGQLNGQLDEVTELVQRHEHALSEAEAALEQERQAQRSEATVTVPDADSTQVQKQLADLLAERASLKELVRERTDQANQLRNQLELSQRDSGDPEGDNRLIFVLNQQLKDARAENGRLATRLRENGGSSTKPGEAVRNSTETTPQKSDDLTQIKGIGIKLAQQLRELGIYRFQQIADLTEPAIALIDHPLYPHRARIKRDDWAAQAAVILRETFRIPAHPGVDEIE